MDDSKSVLFACPKIKVFDTLVAQDIYEEKNILCP
jgi:hypothetical protein